MAERDLNVASMRRLDARLGRPLCRVLTLARRLGGERALPSAPPRRILIVKLAEQGATVAAHPALVRATELVGPENVFVAVFEQNRPVLDELGVIPPGNVLTVRTTTPRAVATGLLRVVRRCRWEGIDAAVDLEFFSRTSAVLMYLSGATRRVGLHSFSGEGPDRGDLLTHRISGNPTQHVSDLFRSLVEALDQPTDRLPALDLGPWPTAEPPRVEPTAAEQEAMRVLLDAAFSSPGPHRVVILNPNSGDLVPLRRWPVERYVELAHRLLAEEPDLRIVLTGSPGEVDAVEDVRRRIGSDRCASLAGRTTLHELLVLYHQSAVLVTNDSGPAHYATLTPIHVVTLFGPETPAVFGPTSPRSTNLWAGIACSPCVNMFNDRLSPCHDNVCMQRITVDEVTAEVLSAYRDHDRG